MTKKDIYQNETTVRVDILTKEEKEIKKADSITDKSLFVGDSVIITNDTGVIMVNPFVKDGADSEIIAVPGNVNAMLYYDDKGDADITNDYLYYYNGANQLCRINVRNENAVEERVSEDTVTTTWYNPEFIMIGNDLYVFYLDNSTKGESNIKYVNLSVDATGEDTDEDGENDKFYLENQAFLGKVIDKDQAKMVDSVISEVQEDVVDGVMQFEEENGVLTLKSYKKAQELYDAQTDAVKDLVSDSNVQRLKTYYKAIEMANLYNELADIKNYKKLSETEKQALKQVYIEVKAEIETFIASEDYAEISGLLGSDLNAYYQNAKAEFEKTAE